MVSQNRSFARKSGISLAGFTLVELLVVIGIIAMLISILLPVLSKARAAGSQTACKSLLRQYALATLMYTNDNHDVMPDAYKYLDYDAGIVRYFSRATLGEDFTRCPADGEMRLGTFGNYTNAATTAINNYDYTLRDKNGNAVHPRLSIGINPNPFSDGQRVSGSAAAPRWVKPRKYKSINNDLNLTKIMMYGDWQNFNGATTISMPIVRPGDYDNKLTTTMGPVAFRHSGQLNVVYLDGHVGVLRPNVHITSDGLDMAPGADWVVTPAPAYLGGKPLWKHSFLLYPFGPGYEGNTPKILGDYPSITID
jgi:prepilin-type processing-associated H-X9-DG protein/prepilin-type N-terminal cleavage/methylation domain-containing protein